MSRSIAVIAFLLAACGDDTVGVAPPDAPVLVDAAELPDLARPPDMTPTGPLLLSETGLYSDLGSRTLAPGIIQYAPRYPLWSDGSEKARFLLLPPNTTIDTSNMDDWVFPVGTKLWKQFAVPASPDGGTPDAGSATVVETRLLWKVYDDSKGWWEVAYVWKADGSDAVAAPNGVEDPLGTVHRVPAQMDCNLCHGNLHDVPLGVSALQLSSPDGKSGALTKLAALGLLSNPPSSELQPPGQGLVQDALGYLHGNCGHCHNDDWAIGKVIKLRMRLSVQDTMPELTGVYRTGINKKMGHNLVNVGSIAIVPGDPDHSQLLARMGHRDDGWEMPPVCTKLVDATGTQTIQDWISALRAVPDGGQ